MEIVWILVENSRGNPIFILIANSILWLEFGNSMDILYGFSDAIKNSKFFSSEL